MKKLLVFVFMITMTLQAATVKNLKFDGLIHISQEVASEMIGIKSGDDVDIEKIDKAIKTLYKQGYFEDVWVEDTGDGELVFHFKEKPTIAQIELSGIGENDKEKVMGILGLKKGEVYDLEKATLAQLRIAQYYEAQGYFDTVVEHKKEFINKTALKLNFLINRGEEVFIKSVKMCGAKALEYSDVEPSIANKEAEWLPWMWGFNDGKLRLSDLEYDPERIKNVYMQNGYLDATVSTPFLKAYLDSYTATLTYKIDEGKQYKIGLVDIKKPEDLNISVDELKDEMVLQSGDVFDVDRLRKDVKKVETAVANLGYAYARVIPDIQKNKEKAVADIYLRVVPGNKVYINDVRISGNSRTIDRVVRREVFLAAGDLYNKTDLEDSKSALKRSSYFEDVKIEEKRVSKDKIDLIVKVKEASTGSIGGGIGYGSSDGLLLNASVSDTNIFGSGITASVNVDRSDKELSGKISLNNPRIFDSIYSLGGSIYRQDYSNYNYNTLTTGFSLNVGRRFGRHFSGSIGYILQSVKYSNFQDTTGLGIYTDANYPDILKSSIIPALSFNNTDDYYLPRKGMSFKTSLEFAGLGGDAKFAKSITKFNYYYGLRDKIKYDLILRYKAQAKYLIDNGYVPLDDYFEMGGISSVRGYSSGSLYPTQVVDSRLIYGGNMMFANSVEASFPLIERLKMRGALFLDYGMIGYDGLDIKRAGTGISLEWISPMGPISLIFAKPLLEESGDNTSSFEFSMGRQF
jgi:outer membrane protein insertion porin family